MSIEVTSTAFTFTSDLDIQSQKSYGHEPYTCERSRPKVTRFKVIELKHTDGQTDEGDCITSGPNAAVIIF